MSNSKNRLPRRAPTPAPAAKPARKPRKPAPKTPPQAPPPLPGALHTRLSAPQLLAQFRKLLPARLLASWLAASPQDFYQRAFTPLITLWYFIFQRLQAKPTLSKLLSDARAGGADALSPRGKHLSRQLRSLATAALSKARRRLPLDILSQTLPHCARRIRSWSAQGLQWHGWNVGLIDGTTRRLRPHNDIPRVFPPHRPGNCKKEPYWCLTRAVAVFCLYSGVVLDCVEDNLKQSEQALCARLLARGPWEKWLFIGDRNFGVYSVVRALQAASAQGLVRLTRVRARKLARQAGLRLAHGLDAPVIWRPGARDRSPAGQERVPVAGRLLVLRVQRPGFPPMTLYWFTTLTDPALYRAAELADLYGQRWQVELYLRFVKTQMGLGFLECKSADLARKEWLAGLIAYNLIRSLMVAAAARAQIPVKVLSFSRTAELFHDWLIRWLMDPSQTRAWEQLLNDIAACRQPHRKKPRPSEPRAIREFKRDVPKLVGSRAAARAQLKIANAKS